MHIPQKQYYKTMISVSEINTFGATFLTTSVRVLRFLIFAFIDFELMSA